ncbi:MAG: adenine deaminase [Bacilli bacterium]|nr:adenine deaminase [Bacilli bacterium]
MEKTNRFDEKLERKRRIIRVAHQEEKADIVIKNAHYLDVFANEFSDADIAIAEGLIVGIGSYRGMKEIDATGKVLIPGLIDAHIHLESSLVLPDEFARAVLPHGTTCVITDPHEIANVLGTKGIDYMLEATSNLPIDVHFMLPSCVPATPHDESGAILDVAALDTYYHHPKVLGLAEMMDYVGILKGDPQVVGKIVQSQIHHKKIDGHAPDLSGDDLNAYVAAGVYSDHECFTIENAIEKLKRGQFIMIREGTAAQNLDALMGLLIPQYYSRCMFATDDKHPHELLEHGHIDSMVKRAIKAGVDPIIALKVATHHAARYFLLNNKGAIAPGYLADLVIIDSIENFHVETVLKKGKNVFDGVVLPFVKSEVSPILHTQATHSIHIAPLSQNSFMVKEAPIIGMEKGQIVTTNRGRAHSINLTQDILKIAMIERHHATGHIGVGFIQGYGLSTGAIATSIAHDAHNIIVVGTNDEDIKTAVERIDMIHGGMVIVEKGVVKGELSLPIAGLISDQPLEVVNNQLKHLHTIARQMGVNESIDPFMSLSFMSLTVIPELRITTHGIFDVHTQTCHH